MVLGLVVKIVPGQFIHSPGLYVYFNLVQLSKSLTVCPETLGSICLSFVVACGAEHSSDQALAHWYLRGQTPLSIW